MADLSLNSLSVSAIQSELHGTEEARLKKQAANNVVRQQEAAALRKSMAPPSAPSKSGSSKAPASSKPPPEAKPDPNKEVKELAEHIQKVESFMNSPTLGPRLRGIAVPRNGTLAEYKVCLEQIRNKLGEGLAGESVRRAYITVMGYTLPLLESESVSQAVRMPPNSAKFLGNAIDKGAFSNEFEELAIEYAKFFRSGPIVRLVMGTFYSLLEYKKMYESGVIDPMTGELKPEIIAAIQAAQAAAGPSVPPPQPQPEVAQPEIVHPPPMRMYPEQSQTAYVKIEQDPVPATSTIPTISSRDELPFIVDDGIGVGDFEPKVTPVKKPPRSGRRGV